MIMTRSYLKIPHGHAPMRRNVALLLIFAGAACGEEPRNFNPADFDTESEDFIANRFEFPDIEGDLSLLIRCQSRVSRSGRMSKSNCFALNDVERLFAIAIEKAAGKSSVTPAIIDGKKTKVWFEYAVRVAQEGDRRWTRFYPNWGLNANHYGTDYVAAQPYAIWEWPDDCWWPNEPFFVLISVLVRSDGTSQDAEVYTAGDSASSKCTAAIRKIALNRSYLPAFVEGKPADAKFLEAWWRGPGRPDMAPYDILMPNLDSDSRY
jgi:hypothetical protein